MAFSTPDFIEVLCVDDDTAELLAGKLFQRCFRMRIPNFPKHYVAVYRAKPDLALAYVHFTLKGCELGMHESGHFILGGGLCIDEHAYRRLAVDERSTIRLSGGIAQVILGAAIDDSPAALAIFGLVGDKRSAQVVARLGFKDTKNPQIKVKWKTTLSLKSREKLLTLVEAEGSF